MECGKFLLVRVIEDTCYKNYRSMIRFDWCTGQMGQLTTEPLTVLFLWRRKTKSSTRDRIFCEQCFLFLAWKMSAHLTFQ